MKKILFSGKAGARIKIVVVLLLFTGFTGTMFLSCTRPGGEIRSKSPEASPQAYQDRTPEQLLKQVALRQIKELRPGDYKYGPWDSVLTTRLPQAPWFGYPMGVMLIGLQHANRILEDTVITAYVRDYLRIATDDYAYSVWQRNTFGKVRKNGGRFDRLIRMSMLDDCGAESGSMLEALLHGNACKTKNMLLYLNNVAYYVTYRNPRLQDRSFWRPWSAGSRPMALWADDLYMSSVFLVRWSEYKQDTSFLNDAVRQVINYAGYLQDRDGIFWHAYLVDEGRPARFKWGRANGWVMMAMADVLTVMPEDHPRREKVLKIYRKMVEGLKKYQAETGLWYQVIDHPELNWGTETSCSAMFTYGIARGINRGWIDTTYTDMVKKAVSGLNRKVEADGTILGVCRSASIGDNLKYYEDRPTRPDDQHGPGPLMLALSEYLMMGINK